MKAFMGIIFIIICSRYNSKNNLQKKEKISKITKYCNNLSLQELDFIIKIIKSMQL
jgi:hypothetical protein